MTEKPPYTNRLASEKSPYLLQHAHNPVDWYPWGDEAFEKAKSEDKPIFLSIGYATCHWCHVMAHESFQNLDIAKILNETFVNVKVDREELPYVDSMYMELAQALMTSSGGWPLNLVLTPDLKPFFAVTYLPPNQKRGMVAFPEVIKQISTLWAGGERERLVEQADKIVEMLAKVSPTSGSLVPTEKTLERALETLFDLADPVFGGIRGDPKFPMSYQTELFLEFARSRSDSRALFLVELTLDHMARGGIYDHLGGGFSRYSVDEKWRIPHFEKMLYDNALLISAYAQSWRFTRNPRYRRIVEETLAYVMRDMSSPEGGFYSAEDADSEGCEGRFYTWTPAEIKLVLPSPDAEMVCLYYGVGPQGNFEGRNILRIDTPLEELALQTQISFQDLQQAIGRSRGKLLEKRQLRPRPFKDDKVLTSWNGLMIDALVKAAEALEQPVHLAAAKKAADFIRRTLWKEGKLFHRYREGEVRFPGTLEDYAYLIKGLLSLFTAGQGMSFLQWAIEMADLLEHHFKAQDGAFYQTEEQDYLLMRKCELYDGAEPSGNAVHAENLLRLYQVTQEGRYLSQAEDILKAAKPLIETYPPGACYELIALQRYTDSKAPLVVIALDEENRLEQDIRAKLSSFFQPHLMTIWKRQEESRLEDELLPWLSDKQPIEGRTAVYICRQDRCLAPVTGREQILEVLSNL